MLKRLLLAGFKSFADRTEFDFPSGLTAIVGPNGSGKSNVVDAVRWVLGEQSAKSLRGSEMADVIFNGSATRRGLGMAEVTLTMDNSARRLATEAEEVSVTRRVYRSGEGEYLINNQPSRLKDIKDLFLGSGAGADAYSIIEQGRVDSLLQSSTKERRAIFEEAAGISRFRARKVETLRKLERVDQNLLRLKDIVDEVEKQLRSVRLQAAKAQRYKEYSDRLRELRVRVGLMEYGELAGKLEAASGLLAASRQSLQEELAKGEERERQLHELETALEQLDEGVREQEAALANFRQVIAADQSTLGHETQLSTELEADRERTRGQAAELTLRLTSLSAASAEAEREFHEAQAAVSQRQEEARQLEGELAGAVNRLAELHDQLQGDKDEHVERMRQAGQLHNDVIACKADLDNLARSRDRLKHKSDQAAGNLASLERQLQEMSAAEQDLQDRLSRTRQALSDNRQERERLLNLREQTGRIAAELREQRSGLASRIEVLEGLERSHEGLDTGVREVFTHLEQPNPGPWRTILGMVADFLTVRREYAPLIDLALGPRASVFLVKDLVLLREALEERQQPFSGRVSFFPVASPSGEAPPRPNRLLEQSAVVKLRMPVSPEGSPAHPGVVALAEQLVHCDHPQLSDLPRRLLAQTLIVRDLATARAIAAYTSGYRFITLKGELLEADGTLTVGTHRAELGLLSRKSELRELREQVAQLDQRLVEIELDLADLLQRSAALDREAGGIQQEIDVLAEQASDLRSRLVQHRERRDGLHEEVALSRTEMDTLEQEIQRLESTWQHAHAAAERAAALVQQLQDRMAAAEREVREREGERQQKQERCLEARVALAQVEERLGALKTRAEQLAADVAERDGERREAVERLDDLDHRLRDSMARMLVASSSLAQACVDRETADRRLDELSARRDEARRERQVVAEQVQGQRQNWQAKQQQAHAHELEANDLQHRLDTLCQRLRDDYQIELAEEYRKQPPPQPSPEASEVEKAPAEEIEELRRKLSRLGSVNLEALQELQELETRATSLQAQYDDLVSAKKSLEEIISRINADSRRLFAESLENIRIHFQELFRKLFGGGQADIVLEDPEDILETGIEIIARPPGKELRSISLMSGGEKTLAAVALLLAIFRSKPSPFCILDEVDAALDEANIGRLASVLREFLDLSQFILITHSKRTMATADVLYGVTMQESGVSKRISVRFEDWPDDERQTREQVA